MQDQVIRLGGSDHALAAQAAVSMFEGSCAPQERLIELLDDRRNIVLACMRGQALVGCLVAYQFPSLSGDRLVYLYDIEVESHHRRHGIGTSLVETLIDICRSGGVDGIWVGSGLDNVAACNLWEKTGATRVSEQFVEFTYDLKRLDPSYGT